MTGFPFRAFLAAGKWAFITCLISFVLTALVNYDRSRTVSMIGITGRTEFEVFMTQVQAYILMGVLAFGFGNIYAVGVWIVTRLFFRQPLTMLYVRNITLLCGIVSLISTSLIRFLDGNLVTSGDLNIIGTIWTAFLGNRFAASYLRMQQKRKNV
jgi:hypothetical protein